VNLLIAIEQFLRMLALGWSDLRRGRVLPPLLLLLTGHVLALVVAANPTLPIWSFFAAPLIELRFGALFLHYPQSWIGLPQTGSGLRVLVDLVLVPFVATWVLAWLFPFLRERRAPQWQRSMPRLSRWFPAFVLNFLLSVLYVVVYAGALRLVDQFVELPHRPRQLLGYAWTFAPALLLSMFLYALPAVVDGHSPWWALRWSLGPWRRNRILSFLLALLPIVIGLPFGYLLDRSAWIAQQLRPEIVLYLMIVQSLFSIVVGFLVLDAATRIFEQSRGGTR
jgi:hypothetical protein